MSAMPNKEIRYMNYLLAVSAAANTNKKITSSSLAEIHRVSRYAHIALVDLCVVKKPNYGAHVPEWTWPTAPGKALLKTFIETCASISRTAIKTSKDKKMFKPAEDKPSIVMKKTQAKTKPDIVPKTTLVKTATIKVGSLSFNVPVVNKKIELTISDQLIEITL